MDSLHAIGFYVSATLSVGGALLVALLADRARRGLAMGAVAFGMAGILLSLSAGFAAAVTLICYLAIAILTAGRHASVAPPAGDLVRQVGALGAAALLAVLAYSAFNGDFMHAGFYGGELGTAAVGRLLFTHDAAATEAVGAIVLAALAGATAAWRRRERGR